MFEDLRDKVGVITGGNGRLGQTFASALCERNRVHIFDLQDAANFANSNVRYHKVDITNELAVRATFEAILCREGRLDFLVNNAAIQITRPFEKMTVADFSRMIDVNLSAAYSCIQAATQLMIPKRAGNIVNVASIYGVVSPDPNLYGNSGLNSSDAYAASKGGLIQLTRYLAVNLAKYKIRVNAISPAGVFDDQPEEFLGRYIPKCPLGRMLERQELAGPLLFLLSEASSYITGHNLIVDGGFTVQ